MRLHGGFCGKLASKVDGEGMFCVDGVLVDLSVRVRLEAPGKDGENSLVSQISLLPMLLYTVAWVQV